MSTHHHEFVNQFDAGQIAFGLGREQDERSLVAFLQKFTDDDLMDLLIKRLSDAEILEMVDSVTALLRRHLSEEEYHRCFLKEEST